MHDSKALQIKEQIDNGDSDLISWSELLEEFTDMADARQLAALKLLNPGKLNVLINLLKEALPQAELKALKNFTLRMSQEGLDRDRLIEFLKTGQVQPMGFEKEAAQSAKSNKKLPAKKESPAGRIYVDPEVVEERQKLVISLINSGWATKEIVDKLESLGMLGKRSSGYPLVNKIRHKLKGDVDKPKRKYHKKSDPEPAPEPEIEPEAEQKTQVPELSDTESTPEQDIIQEQDLSEQESIAPAAEVLEQTIERERPFVQMEPTAHYIEDEEIAEAEREFSQKASEHHSYY